MTNPLAVQIFQAFTEIAVTVLSTLLIALATRALQRLNMNLSAQQEARLRYFAEKAVNLTEETVLEKGLPKLAIATAHVEGWLPKADTAQIQDAIHAELARQRADAGNELFKPKVTP